MKSMKSMCLSPMSATQKFSWRSSMRLILLVGLVPLLLLSSCKEAETEAKGPPPTPKPTPSTVIYMRFNEGSANQITVTPISTYEYKLITTGGDPYISTNPLTRVNPTDSVVLTFEYKCNKDIPGMQIFFANPVSENRSVKPGTLPSTSSWKSWSVNVSEQIKLFSWGKASDYLRMDFGTEPGANIQIRNIHLRSMTAQEKQEEKDKEDQIRNDQELAANLRTYLSQNYSSRIDQVAAGATTITIKGSYSGDGNYALAEITPYMDATQIKKFALKTLLTETSFNINQDRYVIRDGIRYDRTLSKWMIVKVSEGQDEIASHARYADQITSIQSLPAPMLASKKGLGGFNINGYESDIQNLGITSITVNITSNMMYASPGSGRIVHPYGDKTYYFDLRTVDRLDQTMLFAMQRGLVVAAIVLINKASHHPDQTIGRLLQHPSYLEDGIFTMPNMTNPASVNCYAALLDFLAKRYSTATNGRIHKWIMHNEVDCGLDWTNMGVKPVELYTDAYVKSMRMCYNIARRYDPTCEIMGSFTHSWKSPVASRYHATRDMIDMLVQYTQAEGDFYWGLACHPYPQDLNEPKTWNDNLATFSMDSPLVTFKNLEVLDRWIKKPAHLYKGTTKRSLWLSENGTNSRTYSSEHLTEQAAGFAYAWKKIKALDGIDGIQWHNWIDNRDEGGLRIGLRKFPDEQGDPAGKKPVWYAYEAAGTEQEDAVFNPYLAFIGISNWDIIQQVSE